VSTSHRRPRVTIVAHEIHDGGGMERAMAELVRRAAPDWDITVVARRIAPTLRSLVTLHRVRVPARPAPLSIVAFGVAAAPLVRGIEHDLVHTVGAVVPNRVDVASVHYCHAVVPANTRSGPEVSLVRRANSFVAHWCGLLAERWCYRPGRLRRFAAVSPAIAGEVTTAYPGIPVTLTPNGVDPERFAPDAGMRAEVRREERVGDDVVLLFVGGNWAHKGLALAIRAIGRLVSAGAPVRLWVVGRGDAARYGRLADECGASGHVEFFGFRHDPERFFRAADVFVLPTRSEAFCIAAFEAASAGLPLVMTDVGDVAALVKDGTGGRLVEPEVDDILDALAGYVSDADRRASDGNAARERASRYTWDAGVSSVLAMYRELLGVDA
jgi:UDP-glucose:(heptosyl)LPS alpha-1,3-glucosyltransferase